MTLPLLDKDGWQQGLAALRADLVHEDGPRISTMRNYRFAILPYPPKDELRVRADVQRLSTELVASGWVVLSISLERLLHDRIRGEGERFVERVIASEKATAKRSPERGLGYLKEKIAPLIEGPDGIAADCARIIATHADANPDKADRTLALIGRAGALYPFFRSSALLRHIDGHTRNVPVVLLYPGERRGHTSLSFMGVLEPDSDYRPRIYP
jgi:hypothetical protein